MYAKPLLTNYLDVILSLTRTSRVGYLRDLRRLTVALSRARLGLYILGRREVFESCYELKDAFNILFQRSDKLTLVTGEMYPTERPIKEKGKKVKKIEGEAVMEGVEHLGQYVYEMTNAKVEQIKRERGIPQEAPLLEIEEGAGEMVEEEDVEPSAFEAEE